MKGLILLFVVLFSSTTHSFEVKVLLKKNLKGKQIFLMERNTRVERGSTFFIFDGEKNLGEVDIIKVSKNGRKAMTRMIGQTSLLEKGVVYKLKSQLYDDLDKSFKSKHFGHVFLLDNTNRDLIYAVDTKDGESGTGKYHILESGIGIGYEHMFNVLDDLFHVGGGASYEFGKDVSYELVNYSNGTQVGGVSDKKIKSILTFFVNFALNIQDTFDLYFGFNQSNMAMTHVTHSSFGYQAGIAAMKNHIRLGLSYRVNTYSSDVELGNEKIIANDIIGTIGYVF